MCTYRQTDRFQENHRQIHLEFLAEILIKPNVNETKSSQPITAGRNGVRSEAKYPSVNVIKSFVIRIHEFQSCSPF